LFPNLTNVSDLEFIKHCLEPAIALRQRVRDQLHFLDPEFKNYIINVVDQNSPNQNLEKVLKHAHLRFITTRGNYLVLHDVRRFAKWKCVENWNKGRGPCPLTEFDQFREHLLINWFKSKAFNVPINELLMNQGYFNGIGNYLRAEILYRLDINPFTRANELSTLEIHDLIMLCHLCVRDAYALGGGQLKDWHNPNGTDGSSFSEWMKCYGILSDVVDKTGRRFWFDSKWQTFIPEEYSQK
jgi:endonuclease VIII-like 1